MAAIKDMDGSESVQAERPEKRKKLSVRVIIYCSALAAALCIVLGGLGYYIYYTKSMDSYKMYVESTLNIVNSMIDADDMRECIRELKTSPVYDETQRRINDVKSNTMVQFIYIIAPLDKEDIQDVIYVCNAFTEQERLETPEDLVTIGEPVQEDAFTDQMLEVFNKTMFEAPEISYVANNAGFGNMLTGTKPVVDSEGKTICLVCVDFSMEEIYNTMYNYLIGVLLGTGITALLSLLIIIRRINKTIVVPIREMAGAAGDFISQSHKTQDPTGLAFHRVTVHSRDEIKLLSDSISDMMEDTVNYMSNLTRVTADKERISAELSVATQIQESMIPKMYPAFPERSEFDIYGHICSARQMGGSFFDYFFIDNTHFGFFIGDINHTGIPAALMMVITRTMIKNYSQLGYSVDKVFWETNNQISGNNESAGMKITAFMGIIDLDTGVLTYVNAGHRAPYLKHSGEDFEPLASKGCFALGSMANVLYWKQSIGLVQGDLLFMYTGGLIEAADKKGENFSEPRMVDILNQTVQEEYSISGITGKMENAVFEFMDGNEQNNDIAILLFRYFGA